MTQLKTFALAAASKPPSIVATASPSLGNPWDARNITGRVVTRSSSIMRGLVKEM